MIKYGYKAFALGGIVAGSLIASPAVFAHGGRYSSNEDTTQSYAWSGDTYSSNDTQRSDENSFSDESPQMSNDSDPAPTREPDRTAMNQQLQQDQEKLDQDLRSGASDDQIAQDQRAIELDQQGMHESVAFNGDGTVVVIPG